MKTGKLLSIFLCLVLLIGLAASCSGGETTTATTGASTTKAETTATTTEAKPLLPYEGDEITFTGLWVDFSTPEDNLIDAEIYKKIGNIKFDWDLTGWDDYYTKIETTMAAGDLYDITVVNAVTVTTTYGPTGVLLDFNAYKDIMPNVQVMAAQYPAFNYLVDAEDHRYVLYNQKTSDWPNNAWTYNKTLFEKLNLEIPTTDAELLDVLRKIKAAEGFAGYPAVYGSAGIVNEIGTMYGLDTSIAFDQETRKWYYGPFENDNYKNTLQFINTMWNEGLMDLEADTQSQDQSLAKMVAGKWALAYYWEGFTELMGYGTSTPVDWTAGSFITPKGSGGKNYTIFASGLYDGMPTWGVACSAKSEHPELLAAYFDMCYGEEFSTIYNWGVEGLTYYTGTDGLKHFTPATKTTMNPNGTYALSRGINYDSHLGILDMRSYVLKTMPASAIAANNMNIEALQSGKLMPWINQPRPTLSSAENDLYSKAMTPIGTYVSEMQVKFITGQESFDNWDEFLAEIKNKGDVEQVLEILNSKEQVQLGERIYEIATP